MMALRPQKMDLSGFGRLLMPGEAQEPILTRPVRDALLEWLTEIWAADELADVGLKPRQRALFYGAPGTGKTTLAHHLAARIGLPMLAVQPETIIDTWLGSTGRNISALFDFARPEPEGDGPVVLFFDEFDTLAPTRMAGARDAQQERNAAVNTLLQRIEAHDGLIIAATNNQRDIDPAIWRRFDLHIEIGLPGQRETELILERYLAPYRLPGRAIAALATSCASAPPSLLRQLCEGLKRTMVLGPRLGWDMKRESVFTRLLAAIEPHPLIGKPALWSRGAADGAVGLMPWPMLQTEPEHDHAEPAGSSTGTVVSLRKP